MAWWYIGWKVILLINLEIGIEKGNKPCLKLSVILLLRCFLRWLNCLSVPHLDYGIWKSYLEFSSIKSLDLNVIWRFIFIVWTSMEFYVKEKFVHDHVTLKYKGIFFCSCSAVVDRFRLMQCSHRCDAWEFFKIRLFSPNTIL